MVPKRGNKWCRSADLNRGPTDYEYLALTFCPILRGSISTLFQYVAAIKRFSSYPEHSRNFHARLHRNYTSRLLTANLPSGKDTRESDEARFVQGKLCQRDANNGANDRYNGDGGDGGDDGDGGKIHLRRGTLSALLPRSARQSTLARHDGGIRPHAVYVFFDRSSACQCFSDFGRHGFEVISLGDCFD